MKEYTVTVKETSNGFSLVASMFGIFLLVGVAMNLAKPSNSAPVPKILTYQELVAYPVACEKKAEQVKQLEYIQKTLAFNPDIEKLNDADRAYNSRLKATLWWYVYKCEQ